MRKRVYIALLVIAVLAVGEGIYLFLLTNDYLPRPVARIISEGKVIEEIDLLAVSVPRTITVIGAGGVENTITLEHGRICVSYATCPDQVCVKQGYISKGTVPIVCLPSQLMVEIVKGGEGPDAATG